MHYKEYFRPANYPKSWLIDITCIGFNLCQYWPLQHILGFLTGDYNLNQTKGVGYQNFFMWQDRTQPFILNISKAHKQTIAMQTPTVTLCFFSTVTLNGIFHSPLLLWYPASTSALSFVLSSPLTINEPFQTYIDFLRKGFNTLSLICHFFLYRYSFPAPGRK